MFEWNGELAVKIQQYPKNAVELQAFKGRKDDKQQATEKKER